MKSEKSTWTCPSLLHWHKVMYQIIFNDNTWPEDAVECSPFTNVNKFLTLQNDLFCIIMRINKMIFSVIIHSVCPYGSNLLLLKYEWINFLFCKTTSTVFFFLTLFPPFKKNHSDGGIMKEMFSLFSPWVKEEALWQQSLRQTKGGRREESKTA